MTNPEVSPTCPKLRSKETCGLAAAHWLVYSNLICISPKPPDQFDDIIGDLTGEVQGVVWESKDVNNVLKLASRTTDPTVSASFGCQVCSRLVIVQQEPSGYTSVEVL